MYDSVYLTGIECPNCGDTSRKEFQTKDLECMLNVYELEDEVPTDQLRYLEVIGSCHTPKCMQWELDTYKGRIVGFGYTFEGKIYLDESRITDKFVLNSNN